MKSNMRPSLMRSQILHGIRQHHPDFLYSNLNGEPVIQEIQGSDTPSKKYKDMVKGVFMDELQNSLIEYEQRKVKNTQLTKEFGEAYINDCEQNSLMIQNSIKSRKKYYDLINGQQNQRAKEFIDATKVHENKVLEHVDMNYDPKVFHHHQEEYEQGMVKTKKDYLCALESQMQRKNRIMSDHKQLKERQVATRLQLLEKIHRLDSRDRDEQISQKAEYKNDLDKLVEIRASQTRVDKSPFYNRQARHNPITNPIEYHIENPYILKKLVQKIHNPIM